MLESVMRDILDLLEDEPDVEHSAKAVFIQERDGVDHVLVGFHKKHGKYMFPGGRLEEKDWDGYPFPLDEALTRELKEELGLNIWNVYIKFYPLADMAVAPFTLTSAYWERGEITKCDHSYVFRLAANYSLPFCENKLPEDSELDHVRWIPINDTTCDLFPNTRSVLSYLPKYLADAEG